MARATNLYTVGNTPPRVHWTVVRGDTAAFKVYVTDDAKQPLDIPAWDILAKIKRPIAAADRGVITDAATVIYTLTPAAEASDAVGEFTVSLTKEQSLTLQTGDIFDVQLSDPVRVWTVCQGKFIILEDVTD